MEQLALILVIGAISFVKWLMEKSAETRAQRNAGTPPDKPAPARRKPLASPWDAPRPIATPLPKMVRSEETARRLREALGLPPESELPAPNPKPVTPPPPPPVVVASRRAPLTEVAAALERRVAPPPLVAPRPQKTPPRTIAAIKTEPARDMLDELLRSREGLRRAILAQEILGPPKGLA